LKEYCEKRSVDLSSILVDLNFGLVKSDM